MATRERLYYTLDTNAATLGNTSTDNLTIEKYADAMFTLLDEEDYKKAKIKITAKIEEMINFNDVITTWKSVYNKLTHKWKITYEIINSTISEIKTIFTEKNWELETQQALIDNIYAVRFYTIALEQLELEINKIEYNVPKYGKNIEIESYDKIKITDSDNLFTEKWEFLLPKKWKHTFEKIDRIAGLCQIDDIIKLIVNDDPKKFFILKKNKKWKYILLKSTKWIISTREFNTDDREHNQNYLTHFLHDSWINFTKLEQYRPKQNQTQTSEKTIINEKKDKGAISPLYKSPTFYFNPNDITIINNTSWIFANNLNEFNSETNKQIFEINSINQSFQFTTNNKKENLKLLLDNRKEREKQWRIEIKNKENFEKTIKKDPSKIKWFLQVAGQIKRLNNDNISSFEIITPIKINYYANETLAMY